MTDQKQLSPPIARGTTLTAVNPETMQAAHTSVEQWCERKIQELRAEKQDAETDLEIARRSKWRVSGLKRMAALAAKRVTFFEKLRSALKQGYRLIPNFEGEISIFAVRTDAKRPPSHKWLKYGVPDIGCRMLTEGKGRYIDPAPLTESRDVEGDKGRVREETRATGIDEIMDFPFAVAKPEVMEVTSRAMALKLFDEIGLFPDRARRGGDPIVVGRIKDPRSSVYNQRYVTFMIAWHLDLADL